jgi:hypothetical protein
VDDLLVDDRSAAWEGTVYGAFRISWWEWSIRGNGHKNIALDPLDLRIGRFTQSRRILGKDVQYRLKFGRRSCNYLENLARSSLLLQRLGEIAVPCLEFLEQAYVLDRDGRLVSKGFEKGDLLLCERNSLRSTNYNGSEGNPFLN